jgi:crotonobetainyl-CoA:carnitine CoA-transferase CaiB-like acyl-CoA transferase
MEYAMNGTQPERSGNRDPMMSPHNCFPCAGDDQWVSIACGNDDEWRILCHAIGQPRLASDDRFRTLADRKDNEDVLEAIISHWTRELDKHEVTRILQAAGVAAFASMSARDLAEDGHLNERGFFARLPHPEAGVRTHAGIPWRFANAPNGVRSPAPLLGQHTREIMCGVLGYSDQDFQRLIDEQVLY